MLPPSGSYPTVLLSNFGLLFEQSGAVPPTIEGGADAPTSGHRYGFVCEESFGGRVPVRLARHADGRLFLAAFDGLHVAPSNGCGYVRAQGSVAFTEVVEVAFDPHEPTRVFALTRVPPALHISNDGGANFAPLAAANAQLEPDLRLTRLFVTAAASAAVPIIYATGYAVNGAPLVVVRSTDGGASFSQDRHPIEDFGRDLATSSGFATEVDAIGTRAQGPWFLTAGTSATADEVWRSVDDGRTWRRVLTLNGSEIRAGVAFGASAADVYIAGREVFSSAGAAGAHLYVSHDGGDSFAPPIPSPADGPHHRCLAAAGGRLYSCGGPPNDRFLFGVSNDEGQTWTPLATIADIDGPRGCTNGRCFATAIWLCQAYGVCSADLPRGDPQGDGGPADGRDNDGDASLGDDEGSGCDCRIARARQNRASQNRGGSAPGGVAAALLLLLGLVRPIVRRLR